MNGDSNLAVFCDFENIALGVRDAKLKKIDIRPIVERLLLKGSIVAKKAYCDWERYKEYKPTMHEAAFELIEIPHTRISGKNSADIRMVVDALDLCYTKEHIDTFVIVSGDSDFSPLVSKLRENAKSVIGVGVKSSTSDLLMNNCDEFIFYDDLVAERKPARRRARSKPRARADAPAESAAAGKNGKSGAGAAGRSGPEGARPGGADRRGDLRRARGRRQAVGIDDQADPQAPAARLQRVGVRVRIVQRPARGGAVQRPSGSRSGRAVGRLRHHGHRPRVGLVFRGARPLHETGRATVRQVMNLLKRMGVEP